jgi:hypothetical protein
VSSRATSCTVREGVFVEPCARVSVEPFQIVQILDHRTRQPRGGLIAVVTDGALVPLRGCPFCQVELPVIGARGV